MSKFEPRENKTIKFQMMLSEREAKALDDFQFECRFKSRATAIRYLCGLGLDDSEMRSIRSENETLRDAVKQLRDRNAELERVASSISILVSSISKENA